ncbi:hypothetical protein PHLCEN_2v3594 [Hermanssonia centrifuga]|uniref:Uncharacterized protein n=1 Tax=Hermanssonia centrifuga TaxID=98765 RepID=A0A2R6QEQ8_9APHY|nr:hypothetical protein PHLCEN_2v3594 [Hermanssonia centrifuga]
MQRGEDIRMKLNAGLPSDTDIDQVLDAEMASTEDSSEDVRTNRYDGEEARYVVPTGLHVSIRGSDLFCFHIQDSSILSSTAASEYSMAPSQTCSRAQSRYANDLQGYVIGAKTWIGN